jgi:hypothetical protein
MDEPASERITTQEIIDAITTTLANARAEGEPYQSKAEEHLAAFEAILLRIGIESRHAGDSIKRENSELTLLDQKATTLIDAHADDIWARLGCPDYDPIYNILFPSALPDITPFQIKAERLSVVADLLSSGIHRKIDRARANVIAQEIRALATEYNDHLYVLAKHQSRKTSLEAFEASVARIGLLELGTLRRTLRSMGMDELEIKSVVPPPISIRLMGPKSSR